MNVSNQKARRYHWHSSAVKDFIEEPHSGIICDSKGKPLNLTAKKSRENKLVSLGLIKEEPKTFLKDIKLITEDKDKTFRYKTQSLFKNTELMKCKRIGNFAEMRLNDIEFYWHPVVEEKFDLKRLEKTIFFAHSQNPQNFQQFLSLKGIGPKTIRALSLVSEIIYGAKPSYEDPVRYSFSVGGKDGTPYPVDRKTYDKLLDVMERGIKKSTVSIREKTEAERRLNFTFSRNFKI